MSRLFYRGARIHHRLDGIPDKRFVVNVDRGERRYFLNFKSADDFESWYVDVPLEEKTMNEVVASDMRKLIIDIDGGAADPSLLDDVSMLMMFDFERHVESRIREVFATLEIGIPDVIMYRMTDESGEVCHDKLSYHAVVSNFCFSARTCTGLCMIISSGQAWDKCVDTGVYKTVQCVRMEGSTKHGEKRWKWATSNVDFKRGLVSCIENTAKSNIVCNPTCRATRAPSIELDNVDMSQFKAGRSACGTYVRLHRIRPGYCPQCDRTHDRENAAVRYVMGRPELVCWRYLTSSIIGQ